MRPLVRLGLVVVLLVGTASRARADEQGELDKVRASYLGHQYDDAEARLRAMLDPNTGTVHDAALVTQARMYLAAVLVAKNKQDEASAVIERLLSDDAQFEPDPLSFPTKTIDLFIDTRTRLRDKLNEEAEARARFAAALKAREEEAKRREAARVAMLEKMSSEETVTTLHSRWIALSPFGTGQFQNGKRTLGWVFVALEATFLAGAAVTVPVYLGDLQSRSDAYRNGQNYEAQEYINRGWTIFYTNLAFNAAFAATSLIGVLEAEANYVPLIVEQKHRAIPPLPGVSGVPLVTPAPDGHGAIVGLTVRF